MNFVYIFTSVLIFTKAYCANILFIQHIPNKSHYILVSRLAKVLAERGHNTTLISPFKQEKPIPNLREIELTGVIEAAEEIRSKLIKQSSESLLSVITLLRTIFVKPAEDVLGHINTKTIFEPSEHFDLIILEKFGEEALTGLSYYFSAPYILLSTVESSFVTNGQVGSPRNPSYVANLFNYNLIDLSFFGRVLNTIYCILYFALELDIMLTMDDMLQRYFPGAPPLMDLYYNVSLYLINSHPSYGQSVPIVQNMIDIGGFHVEDPKPLPKDLQSLLDNATAGAVYFSMGSTVRESDFPPESREAIVSVFSKLNQTVIWKFEDSNLENLPSNIKIGKWFPQQDLLAHPNIKLFISHGGLLSTTEAIHHGVPIIGIPVLGDQPANVERAVRDGYALHIPFTKLNEENFGSAITEMLFNPKYRNNIRERSRLYHDRPMKPIDTAIYWIEYVIRHQGAPHLKSVTTKLRWYEVTLLDVSAFLVLSTCLAIQLIKITIKAIFCRKKKFNDSKKKSD